MRQTKDKRQHAQRGRKRWNGKEIPSMRKGRRRWKGKGAHLAAEGRWGCASMRLAKFRKSWPLRRKGGSEKTNTSMSKGGERDGTEKEERKGAYLLAEAGQMAIF